LDSATGDALHASNTEFYPAGSTNFEVVHQAYTVTAADRWFITWATNSQAQWQIYNAAYTRWLNSSSTVMTPANHLAISTRTASDPDGQGYNFFFGTTAPNHWTATFNLQNHRTKQFLRFGTDDATASGRQRVYQVPNQADGTKIYWY
jgi:hypothetical protein